MSDLVVRAYNVGFGDAVLVSIPERSASGRETTRHILFDVGNLLTGAKNADEVFEGVVRDIIDRTGGEVDLYVMTHEHLDHVQGLLSAARKGLTLTAKYAWLTGSADPHYYENNPAGAQAPTRDGCLARRRGPRAAGDAGPRARAAAVEQFHKAGRRCAGPQHVRTTSTTCARSHRRTARTTSTAR